MKSVPSLLLSIAALVAASPVFAAPVFWAANGHYYDYIAPGEQFTWTDAKADAESRTYLGRQGHLATITSKAELDFFYANPWLAENLLFGDPWIGAFREPESSLETGWQWVTGETWNFTFWRDDEPNNDTPTNREFYVHFLSIGVDRKDGNLIWESSGWNDLPNDNTRGYFIEYPAVPEPASLALLAAGLFGLGAARRRAR